MIRVMGTANLRINYEVQLNMTEVEFDSLTELKQNEVIESAIDWFDVYRSAEVDEIEVDDLEEVTNRD